MSNTQITIDLTEYRALLATAYAANNLINSIEENKQSQGAFDFLVDSGVERVKKNFKATGLTE